MRTHTTKNATIVHGCLCAAMVFILGAVTAHAQGLIVDHTCTYLSQVPGEYIQEAQNSFPAQYAHRSHGSQITVGLERIEVTKPTYRVAIEQGALPSEAGALCIFQNLPDINYPYPEDYFGNIQSVLNANPTIRVSMFSWCDEMDWESESYVNNYLTQMNKLEVANPNVYFIYMTGNAQMGVGEGGENRYARNNQIRSYCRTYGKILYDFADLDCWYNGGQNIEGDIPVEHPHYSCGEPGCDGYKWTHTTEESCINKGNAFWWMMARIADWQGGVTPGPGPGPGPTTSPITLTADKQFFSASYDTITIFADVQPTSNFTPYIRIATPSGDNLYITSGGGLVGWQEPYMGGPLSLGSAISGYMVATFEFSNVTPGTYQLQGALVGSAGVIGGINSTDLIVE